jgi:hypothetical protein
MRKLPHDDSSTRQHITLNRHTREEIMPSTPKPLPEVALKPCPSLLKEPVIASSEEDLQMEENDHVPDPHEVEGEQTQVSVYNSRVVLYCTNGST